MRGLLMIEPLYHQTIAGNKTMTRRSGGLDEVNDNPDNWELTGHTGDEDKIEVADFCDYRNTQRNIYLKPRYKVGEALYIKEPICKWESGAIFYAFDHQDRKNIKWQNKMFMPASAARAFIKITHIKIERLLDISDEDCIKEGIEMGYAGDIPFGYINYLMTAEYGYDYIDNTPKESFISLYKLANKMAKVGSVPPHGSLPTPHGVDNIWVWVYEYEYLPDYNI